MDFEIQKKIAVLIDAENISHNAMDDIFKEIKSNGKILINRIYGQINILSSWKDVCTKYSITIRTQFQNVSGKNTSDSSLIIDAMDILYTKDINTFYIISSDSDFTGLIARIKEDDKVVIGVGRKQTPESLINACNKFIYIENLTGYQKEDEEKVELQVKSSITPLNDVIRTIYSILDDEFDGKMLASMLKQKVTAIYPEFDAKNYEGMPKKFTEFLSKIENISLTKVGSADYVEYIHNKKINNLELPNIGELKGLLVALISREKNSTINVGQLNMAIKKIYPKFTYKHYGTKTAVKFIELFSDCIEFTDSNNVRIIKNINK